MLDGRQFLSFPIPIVHVPAKVQPEAQSHPKSAPRTAELYLRSELLTELSTRFASGRPGCKCVECYVHAARHGQQPEPR
jgi:hypothetical protein